MRLRINLAALAIFATLIVLAPGLHAATADFGDFDRRAKAGERLSVVFFGASLTWGANASDPMQTSYRAVISQRLEAAYPEARFKFHDAAIGGTNSQLGVFRLQRDVLRHQPDLVFLDFSANDDIMSADPERLASYESLVRRIVLDAHAPVVQVVFPFLWDVKRGTTDGMKRRDAHHQIARAYHTAIGDAIALCRQRIENGEATVEEFWPFDGVHPGDAGYIAFADAAWQAFGDAVRTKQACVVPPKMLHADTYMHANRARISSLGPLPRGWRASVPNPVSAYFDMLMSRWLDDEVVASSKQGDSSKQGASSKQDDTGTVSPLNVKFHGSMVMLFGESTVKSAKYRVRIDGEVVEHLSSDGKQTLLEFDGAALASRVQGNCHHAQVIAVGLDASQEHTLEIEPLFTGEGDQELRLESICVAGGTAQVIPCPTE